MQVAYTNKEIDHNQESWQKDSILFVADLGGTNSNFALLETASNIRLLYSIHIPSKEIKDFSHAVEWVLNHVAQKFDINITKACFALLLDWKSIFLSAQKIDRYYRAPYPIIALRS